MRILLSIFCVSAVLLPGCSNTKKATEKTSANVSNKPVLRTVIHKSDVPKRVIDTKHVSAGDIVKFSETLIGTRYKYGSAVKEQGFDCSGFITYVFNHFNIKVPRSSVEFTNAGTMVDPGESRKGDLILFTGTDTTNWVVGHMGIITQNDNGRIKFIHSASGNNRGVMISELSTYFVIRFVKVIRVFD
jgi:cell wall-associated NlpC family hydrolase